MSDYDHHHHLVVLSEDEITGLRSLVAICFGVALPGLKDDPMKSLVEDLGFDEDPIWPDFLKHDSDRLKYLFDASAQSDQHAREVTETTNTPGTGPSGFGSLAEPPEPMPTDDGETVKTLDFTIYLKGRLSGLLPGRPSENRPVKKPKDSFLERARRGLGLRGPEPAPPPEMPPVKVRVTAYYGHNLAMNPGPEELINVILKASDPDSANSDKTEESGLRSGQAPQETDSGDSIKTVAEAETLTDSDAEPTDATMKKPTAPDQEKPDNATSAPLHSVSFLVLHSLAANPAVQSMPVATKIDLIVKAQSAKADAKIVFSDVVTCCLTDTLIPASRLSTANTIEDAVLLLLQERDQQSLWMENAWIDVFGTVFSDEYRDKISRHWQRQNPTDYKAMSKLTGADLSMLMVDCDFGGLDVEALEIGYIHATPRNLTADTATDTSSEESFEPAIQGTARIEHTLFGDAARELGHLQLGTRSSDTLHNTLKQRWRPYRTAAVLLSCLSGNHDTAARIWHDHRIACTVYGQHAKVPEGSTRGT